jgi:hypothetical protein
MNLLEHYIEEIYKEQDVVYDGIEMVEVEYLANCWGQEQVYKEVLLKDEWESAKKKGYTLR